MIPYSTQLVWTSARGAFLRRAGRWALGIIILPLVAGALRSVGIEENRVLGIALVVTAVGIWLDEWRHGARCASQVESTGHASVSEIASVAKAGTGIRVIGVGGAGCNAVMRMITSGLQGVTFVVINTDLQTLHSSQAPVKIRIGSMLTKGLGAGASPDVGRQAALEDTEKIRLALVGTDIVLIIAGLGGGIGTGAGPVIGRIARRLNLLTVAVVTLPFSFEGKSRMSQALSGLAQLRESVDVVITIPSDRLLQTLTGETPLSRGFEAIDDVLRQAVKGLSDLLTVPGKTKVDSADVHALMKGSGVAVMGMGFAEGKNRAVEAALSAMASPLLEKESLIRARGVIVSITGGSDFSAAEGAEVSNLVASMVNPDANIILRIVTNRSIGEGVSVTVIATGVAE